MDKNENSKQIVKYCLIKRANFNGFKLNITKSPLITGALFWLPLLNTLRTDYFVVLARSKPLLQEIYQELLAA
jgi:hypothetical protein